MLYKNEMPLNCPVLFLVFNRPDTTKLVFESIRQVRPRRLYVAADGPREDKEEEAEKIAEVRRISTNVDWDCEVQVLFHENNLGLKNAVSRAIDWFFDQEEEGIILEDDCIPDQSFYMFCQILLEKYRYDNRIMAISGDNFQAGTKWTKKSYYFSRYPHCWGWATWKRAWGLYDGTLSGWPEIKEERLLDDIGGGEEEFLKYWCGIFEACYAGKIDSWAYPWTYSCWIQGGLTVLPNVNLVSNIGFGEEATHTKNENDKVANLSAGTIGLPLRHPAYVIRNVMADRYTDINHFGIWSPKLSFLCKLVKKFQATVCP